MGDRGDSAASTQVELDELREAGISREREAELVDAYGRSFAQARAAETLVAALDPDVDEAVEGALYEADGALAHAPGAIRALVEAVCQGAPDPVGTVLQLLEG